MLLGKGKISQIAEKIRVSNKNNRLLTSMFFHFSSTNVSLNCSLTFHFRKYLKVYFTNNYTGVYLNKSLWCIAYSGTPAGNARSMILLDNFILPLLLERIHSLSLPPPPSLKLLFPCKHYLIQTVNSNKYLIGKKKMRQISLHFSPLHILGCISLMTKPQSSHLLLMTRGSFPVLG